MSEVVDVKVDAKAYRSEEKPTWCPGCGDFGILASLTQALVGLNLFPHQVLLVSGIGCGSKVPYYMRANGYDSLHGRALPVATGAKLGNHDLKVVVISGDGDGYGIGGNHFVHTMRRNPDLTHIVENNQVYGLTKGQYSPTSPKGYIGGTSPEGAIEVQTNPIALAVAGGATFVARGFAGDPKHLTQTIMKALRHKGYSLVDILQPCVTYNKINTYDWYKERVYKLDDEPGYDPSNYGAAWEKAKEWEERIPIGVIYQEEGRPTYEEQVSQLRERPLNRQSVHQDRDVLESIKREFL
ncbi:MAG TPA: 2-oxoacid:ferredoxin oxidoreductase subunit beta [Chloroflexota bacterium]|nr:2-oxoacid:ferredoxin oxidoreductase subunit beta [Chloroflexota bacterium]